MPTVLLVDDDEGVRQVIRDHLATSGYEVRAVPDTVAAARELASRREIDICLVDLVMPSDVPDGATFAREVSRQRPGLPIILMTGYYAAAARIGELAKTLIYKPVDLASLEAEIRRLLPPCPEPTRSHRPA